MHRLRLSGKRRVHSGRFDGKDIRHFSSEEIGIQKLIDVDLPLAAGKGGDLQEIVYQDWCHGNNIYTANNPRQRAIVVIHLSLQGGRISEVFSQTSRFSAVFFDSSSRWFRKTDCQR